VTVTKEKVELTPRASQNSPSLLPENMFSRAALTKTTTSLNQPFTRNFSASTANMAIKTYFDCQWTGPKLTCDMNGKVISKDDSQARRLPLHSPSSTWVI
jgi:hypothetical protein